MTPYLYTNYGWKIPGGGTSRKIEWGCAARFLKPYPISDQNLWFSLPYLRPDQKFDTLFQTWSPGAWRVTGARNKLLRHVVGVNIKREMVLSPNDEEVANSSTKHTQFKTGVRKPYPISYQMSKLIRYFRPKRLKNHTLWCRTYLYSL